MITYTYIQASGCKHQFQFPSLGKFRQCFTTLTVDSNSKSKIMSTEKSNDPTDSESQLTPCVDGSKSADSQLSSTDAATAMEIVESTDQPTDLVITNVATIERTISPSDASKAVREALKAKFYDQYMHIYTKAIPGGVSLVKHEKYERVKNDLVRYDEVSPSERTQLMKNWYKRFFVGPDADGNIVLFRKPLEKNQNDPPKKVAYFEVIFDIIQEAHQQLARSRDPRKLKIHIDETWWGIPEIAVKCYRDLCPDFVKLKTPYKVESLDGSHLIISDVVGSRAQLYLIEYPNSGDSTWKWILRYVDYHSGFSQVRKVKLHLEYIYTVL